MEQRQRQAAAGTQGDAVETTELIEEDATSYMQADIVAVHL